MYYTVIKHSGHLRTLEKCRKHLPASGVFYISLVFSNARRVLSQCKTCFMRVRDLKQTKRKTNTVKQHSFNGDREPSKNTGKLGAIV